MSNTPRSLKRDRQQHDLDEQEVRDALLHSDAEGWVTDTLSRPDDEPV